MGFVDFTGSKVYYDHKMPERTGNNKGQKDNESEGSGEKEKYKPIKQNPKKPSGCFGNGFYSFDSVSDEVIPLPPYAQSPNLSQADTKGQSTDNLVSAKVRRINPYDLNSVAEADHRNECPQDPRKENPYDASRNRLKFKVTHPVNIIGSPSKKE